MNSFAAATEPGCAGNHFVVGSAGLGGAAGAGFGADAGVAGAAAGVFADPAGAATGGFGGAPVTAGVAAVAAGFAGAAAAFAGGAAAGAGFKNGISPACQSMCANIRLKMPPIISAMSSSIMPSMPLVSRPLVMSQTIPQRQIRIATLQSAPISIRCALDVMYRPPAVAAAVIARLCPESSSRVAAEYARRWRASATSREGLCARG